MESKLWNSKLLFPLQHLITKEIIKEYPRTTFDNFKGEANVIGDDIRCDLR